jgi:hypothetical protein
VLVIRSTGRGLPDTNNALGCSCACLHVGISGTEKLFTDGDEVSPTHRSRFTLQKNYIYASGTQFLLETE